MVTETLLQHPTRPVLVAINATAACSETLDVAALLAASQGADLEVVYVENANLLRLADLPVTREIDRVSGAVRDIDTRRVLRALGVEARRLREEIARIGRTRAIRSTLRVARGEILSEALGASERVDVTFVHAATRAFAGERLAPQRPPSPSAHAGGGMRRKPVWSLFEGDAQSARALETANKLAGALGCSLRVLILSRGPGEAEKRIEEVRARVGEVEIRTLESGGAHSPLEARAPELRTGRLLVMAKRSAVLGDAAMRRYLESSPVPLAIVA